MIELHGNVTLICDRCGKRKTFTATARRDGMPVVQWWYTKRNELCIDCLPLSDLDESSAYVRSDAADTSRLAALQAMPRSSTRRRRVLDLIARSLEGLTDDQIIVISGMPHQSVGPRRLELQEGGWIEDSGMRRETRTGAEAIVWILTEQGRRRWREDVAC